MENEQGNLIILLMCIVLMKNLSFDPKALSFFSTSDGYRYF